jgi:hypothetical protein
LRPVFLWQRDKPQTTAAIDSGQFTQPCYFRRVPLRPSARAEGAASMEELRPRFCTRCGQLARDGGRVWVQGHGCYSRQVRGLGARWIVIWVRRYVCRNCGHTMSRLPDWLHPWRWYAATVIVEALYRHLMLRETARAIGARLGRDKDTQEWRSLRRWRAQLLVSPTLWGWLGARLASGSQPRAASKADSI